MAVSITRRAFTARSAGLLGAALLRPGMHHPLEPAAGLSPGSAWLPRDPLLQEIPTLLELGTVPGLAFAVIDGDRVTPFTFGSARRELLVDVSPSTLFEAASLGKPLFAVAVLQLVDRGLLSLDTPLSAYLPLPDVVSSRARAITARHVLSHTTGLPNWRQQPGPLEPSIQPGTAFTYSGEGIYYLQQVVEQLTGEPIERYMQAHIFAPLGMTESTFVWLAGSEARMATGYDERGDVLEVYADIGRKLAPLAAEWGTAMSDWMPADAARASATAFPSLPTLPMYAVPNVAGSLLTSIGDYGRFVAAVLNESAALPLAAQTRRHMAEPQVRLNSALSWGLGWGLEQVGEDELLWHWGANGSFRNFVLVDLPRKRAIVALTNSANGPKIYERIITALTGRDHPAFLWYEV